LVKLTRAVTPSIGGAVTASWTAVASDSGGGVSPLPPEAPTANAATIANRATTVAVRATRRVVGRVRKSFMAILSRSVRS
jgi:hypothetical protein